MGDSWYHRNQAVSATAKAGDCRSAARRLRGIAENLDGTLSGVPGQLSRTTWESARADEWRDELDGAIQALDDARLELERQATILDGSASSWDTSADWHWGRYRIELDAETTDTHGVLQ